MGESKLETELLVIGAGPGGYASALRAADLGMEVTMIDVEERPGGVCLCHGCIPGKTLLYLAEVLEDSRRVRDMGLEFSEPRIDVDKIREWKNRVVDHLTESLAHLCNNQGIQRVQGRATLAGSNRAEVKDSQFEEVTFRHAILATDSQVIPYPGNPSSREAESWTPPPHWKYRRSPSGC